MLGKRMKLTTLFWIANFGLVLTTVYSAVLISQGIDTKKKINFIYRQNKKESQHNEL
ncbi:TPA: hypothetical protein VJR00_001818 [Streptococcus pyogenes]|nr:hypothetical protein [Streptococcus pyogenes]